MTDFLLDTLPGLMVLVGMYLFLKGLERLIINWEPKKKETNRE